MDFTKDPNDRRRVDAERQRNRDAEICPAAPSGPPRSFQRKNNDYGAFAGYDEPGVSAPLELAQHLVFGAVEFARGLGFEPHRDFATVADHLGTWSGPCPIQFGYNGSPFYIQGPYDDVESIAPYPGRQPGQTACPSPSAWVPRTRTPPLSIRSNRGATRLLDESPHAKTAVCTW